MLADTHEELLDRIARHFRLFGEREALTASPLYARLCAGIAADRALLAIAARAWPRRPVPNLFFAAVHYLLLGGTQHPLARFYPSITAAASSPEDVYPAFRAFCLEQRDAIEQLITTRLVQTNEVRRCACLLPGFGIVAREAGDRPLALVEMGASAGLNLLWDRYGYDYGGLHCGVPDSPVQLSCEPRGALRPPIPDPLPRVAYRIGIDLHPVDLWDDDAVLWLRALIWPEHLERAAVLERAAEVARRDPPPLLAGDALDRLPRTLANLPENAVPCVYHSLVVNQFSPEARQRLTNIFADSAKERDLYVVSIEYHKTSSPWEEIRLYLDMYRDGAHQMRLLANCHWHGEWIEWLERQ